MEKVEIGKRIENARSVKESRKHFLQTLKEEVRKEWQDIKDSCENLYVFRSDKITEDIEYSMDFKCCKITVVGIVKKDDDGTYTLSVAWTQLHREDNYNRKTGNLIAARRANEPDKAYLFRGVNIRPLVMTGFSSPDILENFKMVAASIVDSFEYFVDSEGEGYGWQDLGYSSLFEFLEEECIDTDDYPYGEDDDDKCDVLDEEYEDEDYYEDEEYEDEDYYEDEEEDKP